MFIPNYSFFDYTLLSEQERDEYDCIIKIAKEFNESKDVFNIGELTEKGFGIVKDIQYDINNNGLTWGSYFEYIEKLTDIKQEQLQKYPMIELIQFRNYLTSEIIRINEIESILLAYTPSPDEEQAGLDEFEKLGSYLQIRNLANNDITKIDNVRQIKYSLCLLELRTRNLLTDYEKRYNEIIARKNRVNNF